MSETRLWREQAPSVRIAAVILGALVTVTGAAAGCSGGGSTSEGAGTTATGATTSAVTSASISVASTTRGVTAGETTMGMTATASTPTTTEMTETTETTATTETTGTETTGLPELEPEADIGDYNREVWIFMQSHLHTTGFHDCANSPLDPGPLPDGACSSSEGITAFLEEALVNDASDMIITDHNNVDAWFDPAFAPLANEGHTRYATPLRGSEWSSHGGHMTLLFADEVVSDNDAAIDAGYVFAAGNHADVDDDGVYGGVIDAVHAADGLVIINHPELAIHVFPEDAMDADAVEVGIPPNPLDDIEGGSISLHSSAEARLFWQRRLFVGDRLAGTAGADHHHGGGDIPGLEAPIFGTAVNLLRVDTALADSDVIEALSDPSGTIDRRTAIVIDALRRGHVMIVEDVDAARVYLGADTDGDGRFHDARAGDCILPGDLEGAEFRVRVRIANPSSAFGTTHYNFEVWDQTDDSDPGWFVEVDYDEGFPEDPSYEIDPDDPFAIEFTLPYDPLDRSFLRVVLVRDVLGPINDTDVVSNPIYYGDWGAECDNASPLF